MLQHSNGSSLVNATTSTSWSFKQAKIEPHNSIHAVAQWGQTAFMFYRSSSLNG